MILKSKINRDGTVQKEFFGKEHILMAFGIVKTLKIKFSKLEKI